MKPWVHILHVPDYQPGDMPPEGYLQWHSWVEVQRKGGIKQIECRECGKWKTPQELTGEFEVRPSKKKNVYSKKFICWECAS